MNFKVLLAVMVMPAVPHSGTIPATLRDFKIDPPSLLTVPIKNEIPVRVEMTWQPQ
jgi:hypothetical protein